MLYVLISVFCSVTVAVIIKIAREKGINYLQLLVWNYPVAPLYTPWLAVAYHLYLYRDVY